MSAILPTLALTRSDTNFGALQPATGRTPRRKNWPCESNSVRLSSSSSRAPRGCVRRTAGFRPESWRQGQSEHPTPFPARKKRLGLLLPAPEHLADPVHKAHAASLRSEEHTSELQSR